MSRNFVVRARNGSVSVELQAAIRRAVQGARVLDALPEEGEVAVWVEGSVPTGATAHDAHRWWSQSYIQQVATPIGLPRAAADARCPEELLRVTIECVTAPSGGMSSAYGFIGYFLSVILSSSRGEIWDARGE